MNETATFYIMGNAGSTNIYYSVYENNGNFSVYDENQASVSGVNVTRNADNDGVTVTFKGSNLTFENGDSIELLDGTTYDN